MYNYLWYTIKHMIKECGFLALSVGLPIFDQQHVVHDSTFTRAFHYNVLLNLFLLETRKKNV